MKSSSDNSRYESIHSFALSLIDQPLLLFDSEATLTDCNEQGLRLFPELSRNKNWASFFPHDGDLIQSWFKKGKQQNSWPEMTFSTQVSTSHYIWTTKAFSKDGKALGFCLIGTDCTQRDQLESDLKRSLRLVQDQKMALDESSIVAITDQRGIIQYVNETFCRISGYEREELIGKTHAVLKSGSHGREFFQNLWGTISKGKVWKGEIKNQRKDGNFYWVDTTIVPFLNETGKPYQFVAIRNDITEKKLMQERLEEDRLKSLHAEKMASLGELAAGIAHELGNPAASINAWLDVIESQNERKALDVPLFINMIPKVRREAIRIRDIIRSMLMYARDGSRDPLQSENPLLLINQVIDYCSHQLRKFHVEIRVLAPNPYLSMDCRSTEISQLLVNLILNACDAVQDLDERWIEVALEDKGDTICFRISDSGPGIPEALMESIFRPFVTTKALGKGTGLGLSIARTITESHGGTIEVATFNQHTTFLVCIPRSQREELLKEF